MQRIKIGIVEDEVIIAESISILLKELNYSVCQLCGSYDDVIKMLEGEIPDLILLDINLGRSRDGIEVAKYIRQHYDIAIVFLTAYGDKATVNRAKEVHPNAYLIKPFQKDDLYASIEIALRNYELQKAVSETKSDKEAHPKSLFIKDGEHFQKINFDDILYLSSDHVYVTVHTIQKKFLVRSTMQEYLEKFDRSKFIRVHRSYVVNIDKVEKTNPTYLIINDEKVPVSKNHKEHLMKLLNLSDK
jgi:DNA-binding LytR/AlgR family response regulator